jgi:hypothetical protein
MKFLWHVYVGANLKNEFEVALKEALEESTEFAPCHSGTRTTHILATDPLENSVKGQVKCQCGRLFLTFSGASNGSKLELSRTE